jgi:hypothetical protein
LPAGEHADAAHLAHGVLELLQEVAFLGQRVDHVGGAAVGEQCGVGAEQATAELEVDVVVGVEPGGAAGVHRHGGDVVGWRPTRGAQLSGVGGVEGRVGGGGDTGGGGAEEAVAQEVAVADADGVRACMATYIVVN